MVKPLRISGDTAAQELTINMDIPLRPVNTHIHTYIHTYKKPTTYLQVFHSFKTQCYNIARYITK